MATQGSKTQTIKKVETEIESASLKKKRDAGNLTLNALQGKVAVAGEETFQVQALIERFNEVIRPKTGKDIQRAIKTMFYDGEAPEQKE